MNSRIPSKFHCYHPTNPSAEISIIVLQENVVKYLKGVGNRPAVGQAMTPKVKTIKEENNETTGGNEIKEENNEISRGNDNKEENNETSGGNEINSGDEDTKEVNLIVATLIATVTFAAAFTMPGGYINDEGHDQGSAVLVRNAAFRTFVIADTISMMLSSISVLLHLSVVTAKNQQKKEKTFMVESYLITIAMLGMIVAYVTGTYAVLSHSRGIAIATCVIGSALSSLFMFLYYTASKGW